MNVCGAGGYNCGGWSTAGAAAAGAAVGVVAGAAVASAKTSAATSSAYASGYTAGSATTASAYQAGVAAGSTSGYSAGYAAGSAPSGRYGPDLCDAARRLRLTHRQGLDLLPVRQHVVPAVVRCERRLLPRGAHSMTRV